MEHALMGHVLVRLAGLLLTVVFQFVTIRV